MSGGGHLPKEKRPKIINFKVFFAVQKSMNFNYILWLGFGTILGGQKS